MNRHQTKTAQGPMARFGHRVAAFVAELNYAQSRPVSLRNTPERY